MKKIARGIWTACICAGSFCLIACGNSQKTQSANNIAIEKSEEEAADHAIKAVEEEQKEEQEIVQQPITYEQLSVKNKAQTKLSFEELSKRSFEFGCGVERWNESFTIEEDGSFAGFSTEYDISDADEDHPAGTVYISEYTGHFADIVKLDEYTYQMKLKDIVYHMAPGKEEIIDNMKTIYTASYCLGENDTFLIYLPGKPISQIPEHVRAWFTHYLTEGQSALQDMVIADEKNEYGIYSVPRPMPLDIATSVYESYKFSYDYWVEQAAGAQTIAEMNEAYEMQYKMSDECLNIIWGIIKQNVEQER